MTPIDKSVYPTLDKFFDDLGQAYKKAVRAFAGPNYPIPVFEQEARLLLSRIDPVAHHYEVRANTT